MGMWRTEGVIENQIVGRLLGRIYKCRKVRRRLSREEKSCIWELQWNLLANGECNLER
jgi:hypothetical protein